MSHNQTGTDSDDDEQSSGIITPANKRRRKVINYYESESDEENDKIKRSDPNYHPGQKILKVTENNEIPTCYEEAINSSNSEEWKRAMMNELNSLKEHEVWNLIEQPKNSKPIKSKWVYTIKKNAKTQERKFKARLVAIGSAQKYGINYDETFSPVVKTDSLRSLIAYAAMENYDFHHYDVKTAYLYGKLDEEILMEQPPGFEKMENNKKLICKLNKALYGLKQAGRVWFQTIENYLLQSGFSNFTSDKCIFEYKEGNSRLILGLYVDDLIIINSDNKIFEEVIGKLKQKFQIKESTNENRIEIE